MLFVRTVKVNALAQAVLQQVTHCPWIKHPNFQLRGGHFTTELITLTAYFFVPKLGKVSWFVSESKWSQTK